MKKPPDKGFVLVFLGFLVAAIYYLVQGDVIIGVFFGFIAFVLARRIFRF